MNIEKIKEGAILTSIDEQKVVMFCEWANDAHTEFIGAELPIRPDIGKAVYKIRDFCVRGITAGINITTGELTFKPIRD